MNIENKVVNLFNAAPAIVENASLHNLPELEKTNFNVGLAPQSFKGRVKNPLNEKYEYQNILVSKSEAQTVYRTDNGQFLGNVGSRYTVAQNIELWETINTAAHETGLAKMEGVKLHESISYGGRFTKFTFDFPTNTPIKQVINEATNNRIDNTFLNFQISCINSFDGSYPVILQASAKDLACLNGMVLMDQNAASRRHTANFSTNHFSNFIFEALQEYSAKLSIWQKWAEKTITPEQAEKALQDMKISPRLTKALMQQVESEFMARGTTLWAVYSAMTQYSSHNSELFPVKNSLNVDNEAANLELRAGQVSKWTNSSAWQALAA